MEQYPILTLGKSKITVKLCRLVPKDKCEHVDIEFINLFQHAKLPEGNYDLYVLCKSNGTFKYKYLWDEGHLKTNECCYLLVNENKETFILNQIVKEIKIKKEDN